jgi:hypothetical protein
MKLRSGWARPPSRASTASPFRSRRSHAGGYGDRMSHVEGYGDQPVTTKGAIRSGFSLFRSLSARGDTSGHHRGWGPASVARHSRAAPLSPKNRSRSRTHSCSGPGSPGMTTWRARRNPAFRGPYFRSAASRSRRSGNHRAACRRAAIPVGRASLPVRADGKRRRPTWRPPPAGCRQRPLPGGTGRSPSPRAAM